VDNLAAQLPFKGQIMPTATPKKPSPTARRKPATKPAEADAPVESTTAAPASGGGNAMRLKDLVDRVAASTGGKKKDVKEIVEATLTQMGLALQKGEMLNLPEFGKVRVARATGTGPGSAMTLKLRRAGAAAGKKSTGNTAEHPLADPADQG
jgi:nucleoid DNA-binding protein